MLKSIAIVAAVLSLAACGTANAQGKALNNNPNLVTLQDQINAAKISGSCGDGSYLAGINADGSLVCKSFTQQGFTLTVVTQAFTITGTAPGSATVSCPVGERVTGGGADAGALSITKSMPATDGTGWIIQTAKGGSTPYSATAYAVCLK